MASSICMFVNGIFASVSSLNLSNNFLKSMTFYELGPSSYRISEISALSSIVIWDTDLISSNSICCRWFILLNKLLYYDVLLNASELNEYSLAFENPDSSSLSADYSSPTADSLWYYPLDPLDEFIVYFSFSKFILLTFKLNYE